MWLKNSKHKELFVVPVSELQKKDVKEFDFSRWSMVCFFDDQNPDGDVREPAVPDAIMEDPFSPENLPLPPLPPPAGPPPDDDMPVDDLEMGDPDEPMIRLQHPPPGGVPRDRPKRSMEPNEMMSLDNDDDDRGPPPAPKARVGPSGRTPPLIPHLPNVPMDDWDFPEPPIIPLPGGSPPFQPPFQLGDDGDEQAIPPPSSQSGTNEDPTPPTGGQAGTNEPPSPPLDPIPEGLPPPGEAARDDEEVVIQPILPLREKDEDPDEEDDFEDAEDGDGDDTHPAHRTELIIDEHPLMWTHLSRAMKTISNLKSFSAQETSKDDVRMSKLWNDGSHRSWLTRIDEVLSASPAQAGKRKKKAAARKEATASDYKMYYKQFAEAKKAEWESWKENEVYELIDMRKIQVRNYVTGRWVLTIKRTPDGTFEKCKARWVLRGFQDRQKWDQQTDSPTATRPAFRLGCQHIVNNQWNMLHIDLKTAFLQGEDYDSLRDVVCQLPPEMGLPPYWGALLKKPAYGMNDAPRRWWNRIDGSLQKYGLVPTRADRCCYIMYENRAPARDDAKIPFEAKQFPRLHSGIKKMQKDLEDSEDFLEYILDPVTGSPSRGKQAIGFICLHVDDLFSSGTPKFLSFLRESLKRDYKIGSETDDNIMFCGQRVRWQGTHLTVDQDRQVEELTEIKLDKGRKDSDKCDPTMHTNYRSLLGGLNWLQSRTQFHSCYKFSRAASAAAAPTIADVRELNKVVRQVRAVPMKLAFWPLKGSLRILGFPDAAFKNNADGSSQRGQVIFVAEPRKQASACRDPVRGSLVDYESTKIKRTTMSTTVAELYSFMKCFGTCQFLRGLWCDITGATAPLHMRTDANNLVTTAGTTHLPEQKETVHMIQMLRKEACSGAIDDLAHIPTEFCLADPLTKSTISADQLCKAVTTGNLLMVDANPIFRSLHRHKAFDSEEAYIAAFIALGEPSPVQKDCWELTNKQLIRHHAGVRRALFDPSMSTDIPVALNRILPGRRTYVYCVDGTSFSNEDSWIEHGRRRNGQLPVLETHWTGSTVFFLKQPGMTDVNEFTRF